MAIQQKLHTKLVQKLILTPSLQQAIKLLPMSTLELADLLNQEIVENPMLEEVPTEELQAADATAQTENAEDAEPEAQPTHDDNWDDNDYAYFFGDYLDDGLPAARRRWKSRSCRPSRTRSRPRARSPTICFGSSRCTTDDRPHARDRRRPSSATWTTTAT